MDIFTIAPHRHGKMVQWESASSWWKHAFKMWHQMDWSTTISDWNVLQRRQYYMKQPMWFHCELELHYKAAIRNPSTQNVWYNLGMVDEHSGDHSLRFLKSEVSMTFLRKRHMANKGRFFRHILQRRRA